MVHSVTAEGGEGGTRKAAAGAGIVDGAAAARAQAAGHFGLEVDDRAGAAGRGRVSAAVAAALATVGGTVLFEAMLSFFVPLEQHALHVLGHHRLLVAAAHLRHQRVQRQRAVAGNQQHRQPAYPSIGFPIPITTPTLMDLLDHQFPWSIKS